MSDPERHPALPFDERPLERFFADEEPNEHEASSRFSPADVATLVRRDRDGDR